MYSNTEGMIEDVMPSIIKTFTATRAMINKINTIKQFKIGGVTESYADIT